MARVFLFSSYLYDDFLLDLDSIIRSFCHLVSFFNCFFAALFEHEH